jgi:hypothetical protein
MTDDLVTRLRDDVEYVATHFSKSGTIQQRITRRLSNEAADRIEALTAENERLSALGLEAMADAMNAKDNLAFADNEIAWLREALNYAWGLVESAQYPDSVHMIRQMRFLETYFDENGVRDVPCEILLAERETTND